jgi:hypothetical protein
MFDLRSRAGIVGVATGTALLALPVVAAGQVSVLDQVVGGVNQTAQGLAPAPVPPVTLPAPPAKPAPPVPVPAVRAPASPGPAAPPAPAPAPAAAPAAGDEHGCTEPAWGGRAARSPGSRASRPKANAGQHRTATAGAASDERASVAQSDSLGGENAGASGAGDVARHRRRDRGGRLG